MEAGPPTYSLSKTTRGALTAETVQGIINCLQKVTNNMYDPRWAKASLGTPSGLAVAGRVGISLGVYWFNSFVTNKGFFRNKKNAHDNLPVKEKAKHVEI